MYMTCTNKDRTVKIVEVGFNLAGSNTGPIEHIGNIIVSDLYSSAEMEWYDTSIVVRFPDGGLRLVVGTHYQIAQIKDRVIAVEKLG